MSTLTKLSWRDMSQIRNVTIHKINLGNVILRRYQVEYCTGVTRVYGAPPDTVVKFIRENRREFQKVKYMFKDESEEE